MMPARIPLFLFLGVWSVALCSCDKQIASSNRVVQQRAVVSTAPAADKPIAAIVDDVGPVAKTGCLTCHADDKNILRAPSFSLIAKRYSGNQNAADILAVSVRNGSHGKWAGYRGVVMPPNPQLSDRENKILVQRILSK